MKTELVHGGMFDNSNEAVRDTNREFTDKAIINSSPSGIYRRQKATRKRKGNFNEYDSSFVHERNMNATVFQSQRTMSPPKIFGNINNLGASAFANQRNINPDPFTIQRNMNFDAYINNQRNLETATAMNQRSPNFNSYVEQGSLGCSVFPNQRNFSPEFGNNPFQGGESNNDNNDREKDTLKKEFDDRANEKNQWNESWKSKRSKVNENEGQSTLEESTDDIDVENAREFTSLLNKDMQNRLQKHSVLLNQFQNSAESLNLVSGSFFKIL